MKSRILNKKNQQLPVLSEKKTVNKNVIRVKMCEKYFALTKNYSDRRQLPVMKEIFTFI